MAIINNEKWREFRNKSQEAFDRKCQYMASWWRENHEWAIFVLPIMAATTVKIANGISRAYIARQHVKEADINARTLWDPKENHRVTLRHPLTKYEIEDFSRLTSQGMTSTQALMTLNLIA